MSGPHKSLAATRRAVRSCWEGLGIGAGSRVLLAVSGGSDSMALAQAALFEGERRGVLVASVTVDHGWRPESAEEAERVRAMLEDLGADPAIAVSIDAGGPSSLGVSAPGPNVGAPNAGEPSTPGPSMPRPSAPGGPEASARQARYDALAAQARDLNARAILLGHTADDQAETVLLGLGRGSGARSLAGMASVAPCPGNPDVTIARPFLGLRRSQLREALADDALSWVDDPTNEPDSTVRAADGSLLRRSAIRHHALPALEEALGPGVVEALARSASLLRADADALDSLASAHAPTGHSASLDQLRALPRALRTRVLRSMALDAGVRAGELTSWHITTLDGLVIEPRGSRRVDLPGISAFIQDGQLTFNNRTRGKETDGSH